MLSILIASIPQRIESLTVSIQRYELWAYKYELDIHVISLLDNKIMSIGEKRNLLVEISKLDYWVMTDDDDQLQEKYFELIGSAMKQFPDVITYNQSARINEDKTIIEFGLKNENQGFVKNGITKRPAWYCCTWRKQAVKDARFDSSLNWGEDDLFSRTANHLAKTSIHIPEICHDYQHDSHLTTAFK